jgi:hypothetical protein
MLIPPPNCIIDSAPTLICRAPSPPASHACGDGDSLMSHSDQRTIAAMASPLWQWRTLALALMLDGRM